MVLTHVVVMVLFSFACGGTMWFAYWYIGKIFDSPVDQVRKHNQQDDKPPCYTCAYGDHSDRRFGKCSNPVNISKATGLPDKQASVVREYVCHGLMYSSAGEGEASG